MSGPWSFLVVVPLLFSIAVLFGANPIYQFWGTLIWSLFICLLLLPALLLLSDGHHWKKVIFHRLSSSSERWIYYCGLMTLVGAWLGAFPILLDWNRPWQVWPIPSCIGATAGSVLGYLGYGIIHYHHKWRRKQSSV